MGLAYVLKRVTTLYKLGFVFPMDHRYSFNWLIQARKSYSIKNAPPKLHLDNVFTQNLLRINFNLQFQRMKLSIGSVCKLGWRFFSSYYSIQTCKTTRWSIVKTTELLFLLFCHLQSYKWMKQWKRPFEMNWTERQTSFILTLGQNT